MSVHAQNKFLKTLLSDELQRKCDLNGTLPHGDARVRLELNLLNRQVDHYMRVNTDLQRIVEQLTDQLKGR